MKFTTASLTNVFIQGHGGGLDEGEDAKKVRPLVVLAEESGQYNQAGVDTSTKVSKLF